jgi:hypothetical protein
VSSCNSCLISVSLAIDKKKGELVSKSFKSLDELKQFVISEKIANYEKQKEVSQKLFATLKKEGK